MHFFGNCIFSKENKHIGGEILVSDVFDTNNVTSMVIMVCIDNSEFSNQDDVTSYVNSIDTVTLQTSVLDYHLILISKNFDIEVDYISDDMVRIYISIQNDGTILTNLEKKSFANCEFMSDDIRDKYIDALSSYNKIVNDFYSDNKK